MSVLTINGPEGSGILYRVDTAPGPVGTGGMGQVYRGTRVDTKTGVQEEVAVKFLFDDLPPQSIERARREASIQINNENLVRMYDFIEKVDVLPNGKTVSHYHVVSEFLRGVMLEDLLKGKFEDAEGNQSEFARDLYLLSKQQPEQFAFQIVKNVLAGITALHDQGVIHRDIDPSNVMLTNEGKIKLIDFGIAKRLNDLNTKDRQLTSAGAFMGKAAYAAPELVLGDVMHQNETTDIYAVGVMLFQLLTGHLPFIGPSSEVLDKQLSAPVPVKEIREPGFRKIVQKAMAKKQEDRYASASEFRVALEALNRKLRPRSRQSAQEEKEDKEGAERKVKIGRGNPKKLPFIIGAAALALLLVGGGIALGVKGAAKKKAALAEAELQESIARRTQELEGVMLDSADPAVTQTDSLTGIVLHSIGYYTEEGIRMLKDAATAAEGRAQLEKIIARPLASTANACAALASYYSGVGACEVLGYPAAAERDFLKALELNEKALRLDGSCYYALFDLGMAYISADRTEVKRDAQKGIDMLKQARSIATDKGDTAFVLFVDKMIN